MSRIFLFLSTGRCGTQWLAETLASGFADVADVTHEPIDAAYHPRDFIRAYDRLDDMLELTPIRDHLRRVERTIEDRAYIETGWPVYAAIPLYIKVFGESVVRVVHIPRHPVHVAASFVTHGFWRGRADEFATHGVLDPWAPGVVMTEYASRWPRMTPYEKCLYWWAELQLYGADLKDRYPSLGFHGITFEELFASDGSALRELVDFLELPRRDLGGAVERRIDEHRSRGARFNWWEIYDHPKVLAVAESLGYHVRWSSADELNARYGVSMTERIRRVARPLRRITARVRAADRSARAARAQRSVGSPPGDP